MVVFDQLRISDDGKGMYISVHVPAIEGLEQIYLYRIVIKVADQVSEIAPDYSGEDQIYEWRPSEDTKSAEIYVDINNLSPAYTKKDFCSDLFFVFVHEKNDYGECTPCRMDEPVTVGVTFDTSVMYQKVMSFTKDLADDCKISKEFMDYILQWNAFKASVDTEHWNSAVKFYKYMFANDTGSNIAGRRGCRCHG